MPRLVVGIALLLTSCASVENAGPATHSSTPNIVLILADDLGYADVGFQGLRDFTTPNIDHLAASGVRFSSAYVSHPFCSPSRAGLLSGRYQHRFGHIHNPKFRAGEGLPLEETLLPEVLHRAEYVSGLIGKWHLGDAPEYHPLQRGFDEFYGFLGGGHDYFKTSDADAREYLVPLEARGEPLPVQGYLTEQLTQAAVDFIQRHSDDRFFLFLSYNAPHGPLQAPPEILERVSDIEDIRRRTYAAMVAALDDGVGAVLAELEVAGILEGTIVIFLSDNGGPTPANASDNSPLRATKGTVYEGGVRVPLVISWPGHLPAGKRYTPPVSALDIFPTAVAAAGIEPTPELDGVDLMPFLTGRSAGAPHERLFWYADGGDQRAVRTTEHKLVRVMSRAPELYAIAEDNAERADIRSSHEAVAVEIEDSFESWQASHPEPAWQGTSRGSGLHPNEIKGLEASEEEVRAWNVLHGE